jgi:hypothetical protein
MHKVKRVRCTFFFAVSALWDVECCIYTQTQTLGGATKLTTEPYIVWSVPYIDNCRVFVDQQLRDRMKKKPLTSSFNYAVIPTMADRVTRPSNVNAHPGMVDRNPARRSKEEVQAEKQAKAAAKEREAMERKSNIDKVAAMEKAEKQKAKDMDREANDPADPITQARPRRMRKRPANMDKGN